MLSCWFVADLIGAVIFCHLSESYSTIIDMSALDMILQKVTSIEGILRSSPLGDATRVAEAREASRARAIAKGVAKREAGAGASAGELTLIGGVFYWVSNGNVYAYDQIAGKKDAFVGRLKPDGESIDTTAAEVMKGGFRKTRARKGRSLSKNRKTQGRSRRH
jgi:hypothetical protein